MKANLNVGQNYVATFFVSTSCMLQGSCWQEGRKEREKKNSATLPVCKAKEEKERRMEEKALSQSARTKCWLLFGGYAGR